MQDLPYVLVTGGSRGIGREISKKLADEGKNIIIHYNRNSQEAEKVRDYCEGKGVKTLAVSADLSSVEGISVIRKFVQDNAGSLSGLVNAAGIYEGNQLNEITVEEWESVLSVNLMPVVFLTRELVPMLEKGRSPAVVNISSVLGLKNDIYGLSYQASKAAIIHISRSLAKALAPAIRVNSVSPGFIMTDMNRDGWEDSHFRGKVEKITPMGRWGKVEDIAEMVCFLLSDKASFITGSNFVVDGGISI